MTTETLQSINVNGDNYRQQTRQCNKPVCKCHQGQPHGPYWYKNNTTYVGKELPEKILVHLAQLKDKQESLKKTRAKLQEKLRKNEHEHAILARQERAIENLLRGYEPNSEALKELGLESFILK